MNRIKCPDCNLECDSNNTVCINCGFPFYKTDITQYLISDADTIEVEDTGENSDYINIMNDSINKIENPDNNESNVENEHDNIEWTEDDTDNLEKSNNNTKKIHLGVLVRCPKCGYDTYSEDEKCDNCGFEIKDYFEKQNKTTISERIDNFSIISVKEYIDYVINDARNSIKLTAILIVLDVFALLIAVFSFISKLKLLIGVIQSYSVTKESVIAGGSNIDIIKKQYGTMIFNACFRIVISAVVIVLLIVGFIKMKKFLEEDYV